MRPFASLSLYLCICFLLLPATGWGEASVESATVTQPFAEVRSGPGEFYTSRGRVYRDDEVIATQSSRNGLWRKIRSGGLEGWVLAKTLKVSDGVKVAVDAGRDRKTTNYGYDENGRRLDGKGRNTGSGEGTDGAQPKDEAPAKTTQVQQRPKPKDEAQSSRFKFRFGLGMALTDRVFSSNIANSPLEAAQAGPSLFGLDLGLGWSRSIGLGPVRTRLGLEVLIKDRRFGSVTVPIPVGADVQPVSVKVEGQRVEATVNWQYLLGGFGVGPYGGFQFFRSAYQETENLIFFLTTQIQGAIIGLDLTYTHARFALGIRGGLLMPLNLSQAPFDSGEPTGQGYQVQLFGRYVMNATFSISTQVGIDRYAVDFNGLATHTDPVNDEDYDLAREVNRFIDIVGGMQVDF